MSFDKSYWNENYDAPLTMDCIGNAKQHADYLKVFFKLELIDVSSVIDLGSGYGYLFEKVLKAFIPYRACAVEPSEYAYKKMLRRKLIPVESTKLKTFNESIEQWCQRSSSKKTRFDLGLCTSVFQYLSEEVLHEILPIMAMRVKYLYLTVPTDKELDRQIEDLNFHDKYALRRSKDFYFLIINKYFTNISSKIWESRDYFNEETTLFTDLLYRS